MVVGEALHTHVRRDTVIYAVGVEKGKGPLDLRVDVRM